MNVFQFFFINTRSKKCTAVCDNEVLLCCDIKNFPCIKNAGTHKYNYILYQRASSLRYIISLELFTEIVPKVFHYYQNIQKCFYLQYRKHFRKNVACNVTKTICPSSQHLVADGSLIWLLFGCHQLQLCRPTLTSSSPKCSPCMKVHYIYDTTNVIFFIKRINFHHSVILIGPLSSEVTWSHKSQHFH